MSIIKKISKIKEVLANNRILEFDNRKFLKHCSNSISMQGASAPIARDILVFSHTIEKGLSHKNLRPGFGKEAFSILYASLEAYSTRKDKDPFVWSLGINMLQKYIDVNHIVGYEVRYDIKKLLNEPLVELNPGVMKMTAEQFFSHSNSNFEKMSKSRRSVRLYDYKSSFISDEEISACVEEAMQSPSACNRQAVRVYVIRDEDKIRAISDVQKGANGFGPNSGAMLLITADLNYYNIQERRIPMFDSGLFTMTLLYALYEHRIGSCVLNGSFLPDQEKQLNSILTLPENEMIATVVSISKIPADEGIIIANSCHRDIKQVLKFEK